MADLLLINTRQRQVVSGPGTPLLINNQLLQCKLPAGLLPPPAKPATEFFRRKVILLIVLDMAYLQVMGIQFATDGMHIKSGYFCPQTKIGNPLQRHALVQVALRHGSERQRLQFCIQPPLPGCRPVAITVEFGLDIDTVTDIRRQQGMSGQPVCVTTVFQRQCNI